MIPEFVQCILLLGLPPTTLPVATSECVIVKVNVPEAFRSSDVVFSGVVVKLDDLNDRLAFRVDRAWKGPVRREMWIYQLGTPSIGSYVFRPNPDIKHLIFGRQLSAGERRFRVPENERTAFGIERGCGDGPRWSRESARALDNISKGRKPRS